MSRHIAHPAIVHKLNSLMGDDVICWKTNIFHKSPGEARTDWHQVESHFVYESADLAYPSLRYTEETTMATQELTVWTAFSPADKEHACPSASMPRTRTPATPSAWDSRARYVPPSVRVYEDIDKLSGFGGSMDLSKHASVLVSGEDKYGYNRMYETNLNGFPFQKVQTNAR